MPASTFLSSLIITLIITITTHGATDSENLYDFIIIGAGSAGTMASTDLAKHYKESDPNAKILVIEEGPFCNLYPVIDNQATWTGVWNDPIIDRNYSTQFHGSKGVNRSVPLARGRVTGGSNSINAQLFMIANENDFHRWGDIEYWSLDDILSLWDEILDVNPGFQYDPDNIMMRRFINASIEAGFPYNANYNDIYGGDETVEDGGSGKSQTGVCASITQAIQLNDSYVKRRSGWVDFMEPMLQMKDADGGSDDYYDNLEVLVFTRVNKILLEAVDEVAVGSSGKIESDSTNSYTAIGVETYNVGTFRTVNYYASKEVILSAGAYDSPKVLMLSGIGDCDELEGLGIECIVELPGVGKNLQDHIIYPGSAYQVTDLAKPQLMEELPEIVKNQATSNWWAVAITDEGKYHYYVTSFPSSLETIISANPGAPPIPVTSTDVWYVMAICVITQMSSVGYVTLEDSDPSSRPKIIHNYLSTEDDQNSAISCIDQAREIMSAEAMSPYVLGQLHELLPSAAVFNDDTKLNYVENIFATIYHAAGSNKMGSTEDIDNGDDSIVVNNRLQVRNINNLRIADASIMPLIVSANTNQLSMVIGKQVAKFIIEDHENTEGLKGKVKKDMDGRNDRNGGNKLGRDREEETIEL